MKRFIALTLMFLSGSSFAIDFVNVPNASLLKWQIDPVGKVWFRNLNDFDGGFLGCCYNYSLDLSAVNGKAVWATILLKSATSGSISIGVVDRAVPSAVTYAGNH